MFLFFRFVFLNKKLLAWFLVENIIFNPMLTIQSVVFKLNDPSEKQNIESQPCWLHCNK